MRVFLRKVKMALKVPKAGLTTMLKDGYKVFILIRGEMQSIGDRQGQSTSHIDQHRQLDGP